MCILCDAFCSFVVFVILIGSVKLVVSISSFYDELSGGFSVQGFDNCLLTVVLVFFA